MIGDPFFPTTQSRLDIGGSGFMIRAC